jgi:hypothetical protein
MLTRDELEHYKSRLSEWSPPDEFVRIGRELKDRVRPLQFFTDPIAAFGRDAWVATRLATVSNADAVRLGPDRWPDYEEQKGSIIHQYEITEADLEGRRRGDEYKAEADKEPAWEFDPIEKQIARAEQAAPALRRAAEAKATKGYPLAARLVIYLNITEHGIRHKEIEAALAEATAPANKAFAKVWVLWKSHLYLLWDHGQREFLIVPVGSY